MRKDKLLQIRITTQNKERIKKLAKEKGMSVANLIVKMVEQSEVGSFLDSMPEEDRAFMAHVLNYSAANPELKNLMLWLASNQQYMKLLGHHFAPEAREAWQVFSKAFADTLSNDVKKSSN